MHGCTVITRIMYYPGKLEKEVLRGGAFYRTSHGAEIDIIINYRGKLIAVECKASTSPILTRGTYSAINDLRPDATFVVSPVDKGWPLSPGIEVVNIPGAIKMIEQLLGD